MSGSNGGLLSVGGLGGVAEVTPKINLDLNTSKTQAEERLNKND